MNPVGDLRRFRNLPRAMLALLLLALAQTVAIPCAMSAMSSAGDSAHCVYCPPHAQGDMGSARDAAIAKMAGQCSYPHAPTVDAAKVSAQTLENSLATASIATPLPFVLFKQADIAFTPIHYRLPPPTRPLLLTFGVQLK